VETPGNIPAITDNVDVLGLRGIDYGIYRQVGLKEPTMGLGLKHSQLGIFGCWGSQFNPRRHAVNCDTFSSIKDQLRHNLLHPGSACFCISRNYDIAISELKVVPDCRVHTGVLELPGLYRPLNR
jgi:hypothetical protein